ncbi:MAG: sensor domain-containing diguanylate cyclase [Gemmatimonadetes bacterium]|nr:sensor domain-containing diguanylate cyclase [Gemmatimonadota bacterium]
MDPLKLERSEPIAADDAVRSPVTATDAGPGSAPSFELLFDVSPVPTLFEALDGRIVRCNAALAELLGYDEASAMEGRHASELFAERDAWLERRRALKSGDANAGDEVRLRHREGHDLWALDRAAVVAGEGAPGVIRLLVDVTERRAEEEGLRTMAFHDALTGLPNRRLLELRAAQTMALAQRKALRVGLVFLDLVDFKSVNDRVGHPAGDALLRAVGKRLEAARRASDMAARVGGDEFVVLLSGVTDAAEARAGAARIVAHLQAPYFVEGRSFRVGARAAVALYPDHARSFQDLMARADRVLRGFKPSGEGGVRFVET